MNILALLSLFLSVSVLGVGFYSYFTNTKNALNRIFFLFALSCSYCLFIEFGLKISESEILARHWCILGALRPMAGALLLHFVLEYTGYFNRVRSSRSMVWIYGPAVALSLGELVGCLFHPLLSREHWGWSYRITLVPWFDYLFIPWAFFIMTVITITSVKYYKKADSSQEKGAKVLLYIMGFLLVLSLCTVCLDALVVDTPEITSSLAAIVIFLLTFFIRRYNLFEISLAMAAEDIVKLIPEAIFITDLNGIIKKVNNTAIELSGYHEKELIDVPLADIVEPGVLSSRLGSSPTGPNAAPAETVLKTKASQTVPVSLLSETVRKTKNRIAIGTIFICKDIRFEKKAREEFGRLERLETLSLVSGGISHDFNNLLTIIFTYIGMVKTMESVPESARLNLEKAYNAAMLAANLIRQLGALSKDAKPHKEPCSVPDIIRDSLDLALSGGIVRHRVEAPSDLYLINADRVQLMQVFINLFINASQAMPKGGAVAVSCKNVFVNNEEWVEISVADQGCGIPMEIQEKIFEPFFTTKARGTGLGLSVVQSIVLKHGGRVAVSSTQNVGSTFTVQLPALVSADDSKTIARITIPQQQNRRILVMEDDDAVGKFMLSALSGLGHRVVHAVNGSQAIEAFLRHKSEGIPFDLVILNLTVKSDYGAREVIVRLRELEPDVHAILSTGYVEDPMIQDHKKHGFAAVLRKPFDITELRMSVDRALSGS
jgi:PAS domain S-box-containing protein